EFLGAVSRGSFPREHFALKHPPPPPPLPPPVLVTRYNTMQHKRKQQPSEAAQNPLKRQKSTANQKNALSKKRKVAASALPWKKVEVPEMFDDAEGFYGLEVIEGVDVIKDGENIEFVAAIPSGDDEKNKNDNDGDDFEGFSDSEPATAQPE
ncbi:ATP-dependent RNA helicase MAK5, partial [Colletotrichum tanaceti]